MNVFFFFPLRKCSGRSRQLLHPGCHSLLVLPDLAFIKQILRLHDQVRRILIVKEMKSRCPEQFRVIQPQLQKVFNPQKINYGAYSDKLSHLHFPLAPKYEGGPDFGGTFTMNPQKVYLTDAEYQDMVEKIKEAL